MWNFTRLFLVGLCLLIEGIRDLKKRRVSYVTIFIFAVLGILIQIPVIKENWGNILAGVGVGLAMMLLAKITGEKIGYGDGLILSVTGIFLGFESNFILLISGLLFAAISSVILLLCKKANKKTELPFVSFLFAAYVFLCIINYEKL